MSVSVSMSGKENNIIKSTDKKQTTLPAARSIFDIVAVFFVSFYLLSNIGATKLIGFDVFTHHFVADGGAILFPLTYILGDILSEVYGFSKAKRVILLGFTVQIIASITFYLVALAPSDADYENQEAFEAVLGFVPRIVFASIVGYVIGQLLNSYVMVWIKERFGTKHLWVRLITSSIVGEIVDTLIFCFIAWIGAASVGTIFNLAITGFIYKIMVEIVFLPVTYFVIKRVKKREGIKE